MEISYTRMVSFQSMAVSTGRLLCFPDASGGRLSSNRVVPRNHVLHGDADVPMGRENIWGVNRHFQAKHVKYRHLHCVESAASIQTKFCTVINANKYSSRVVQAQTCAQQIQDGGRPPF